jgi:hypothetical protein
MPSWSDTREQEMEAVLLAQACAELISGSTTTSIIRASTAGRSTDVR